MPGAERIYSGEPLDVMNSKMQYLPRERLCIGGYIAACLYYNAIVGVRRDVSCA